jgi:hypothetical protein
VADVPGLLLGDGGGVVVDLETVPQRLRGVCWTGVNAGAVEAVAGAHFAGWAPDGCPLVHTVDWDPAEPVRVRAGWWVVQIRGGLMVCAPRGFATMHRLVGPTVAGDVPAEYLTIPSRVRAVRWTGSNRAAVEKVAGSALSLPWPAGADPLVRTLDASGPVPIGHWITAGPDGSCGIVSPLRYAREHLPATSENVARVIRAATTGPDGEHLYLSTGCWHEDHGYCKGMTGVAGVKRPSTCKGCGAGCVCCTSEVPGG